MASKIKLLSMDKKVYEVDIKVARMLGTIKIMVEDLGLGDGTDEEVPLSNINSNILEKVIEWAEYHTDDPPAPEDNENQEKRTDDIPEWDVNFLKVDPLTLFAIIRAANFLDIKGLLNASYKTLANMIKGKSPEEIKTTFNLEATPRPSSANKGDEVAA